MINSQSICSYFYVITSLVLFLSFLQLGLQYELPQNTARATKNPIKHTGTVPPYTISMYRINATNGATCILIETDGLISISYRNKLGQDTAANIFMPDHPKLSGDCTDSDSESLTMTFDNITLSMYFKKTIGGELWYMSSVDLAYSSSNPIFEHIDRPGLDVKLSTPERNTLLFPTPVGKSFTCDKEEVITMMYPGEKDTIGHTGKLYLRNTRMQSFMYKAANTWGPSFQCSATGTYRDETAPVAVGSTLAVAVLATITGYGVWRYFKVKKMQYGNME